ncbi:hypothetical protein VNO77_32616 [Canavalia gladiata]|uniref:Uncharacterized protein n=1 Tax=Canavalia gladiata TaxID=3824 RepID=A0AAN9Q2A7_CANGL
MCSSRLSNNDLTFPYIYYVVSSFLGMLLCDFHLGVTGKIGSECFITLCIFSVPSVSLGHDLNMFVTGRHVVMQ